MSHHAIFPPRPDGRATPLPTHSPALHVLLSRGPLRLTGLPDDVRDAIGRAIDLGTARLVLAGGTACVARRRA